MGARDRLRRGAKGREVFRGASGDEARVASEPAEGDGRRSREQSRQALEEVERGSGEVGAGGHAEEAREGGADDALDAGGARVTVQAAKGRGRRGCLR